MGMAVTKFMVAAPGVDGWISSGQIHCMGPRCAKSKIRRGAILPSPRYSRGEGSGVRGKEVLDPAPLPPLPLSTRGEGRRILRRLARRLHLTRRVQQDF